MYVDGFVELDDTVCEICIVPISNLLVGIFYVKRRWEGLDMVIPDPLVI